MQKTTELKIVLVAIMGLLCLATAESVVTNQRLSARLYDSGRALNVSMSTIDLVAKQRDWVLGQARLLGQQRDIETASATAAINLLNRIPAAAKTDAAINPHYEAAKVAINGNSSLLDKTNRALAALESRRPN